jgi:hypothetical protein
MPQLSTEEIARLVTGADAITDDNRKKIVKLALALEGNQWITWQGGGNLNNFLDNSKSDRTPKTGTYIQLVCWLWPIYVAWRCKVAKDKHLADYKMRQDAAVGTAALLHHPVATAATATQKARPKFTFGGRDESAMGAAAFYRAGISTLGLGLPGDIVFYYRSGYEQPCHIAIQVDNAYVSSLWTVPRDAKGLDFMWPQAVASVDLAAEIAVGVGGGTVETRHQTPPWI